MNDEIMKASQSAIEKAEKIHEDAVREYAESVSLDMIKMQERIARGRLLPGKQRAKPGEMLAAADKVLDRAQGRPGIRKGEQAETGGVTIIIEAPDKHAEKFIPVQATKPGPEAIASGGDRAAVTIQEFKRAETAAREDS